MYALTFIAPGDIRDYSTDTYDTIAAAVAAGRALVGRGMENVCVVDLFLEVVCAVSPEPDDVPVHLLAGLPGFTPAHV